MTDQEAVNLARTWVTNRQEARRHLVALARAANPRDSGPRDLIRKLYNYPSDLSEQRLLDLIERTHL